MDETLKSIKTALIVVDLQNDFCPGGSLAVKEGDMIVVQINKLRENPIFSETIFTKDWHPQDHVSFAVNHPGEKVFTSVTLSNGKIQELWPVHCVQDTHGSELHKDLIVRGTDHVIKKGMMKDVDSYSGFGSGPENTGLFKLLSEKEIKRVYICGLAIDFCVGASARDALKNGLETFLVLDCSRGIIEEKIKQTVEELSKLGAKIVNSFEI